MSLPRKTTFSIFHSGPRTSFGSTEFTGDNPYTASAAIKPGQSIELHVSGGDAQLRVTAAATGVPEVLIATDKPLHNKGVAALPADTLDYAADEVVNYDIYQPGAIFSGVLLSGEDIAIADRLQIGAGGKFIEASVVTAAAGVAKFRALDSTGGATVADTYLRMLFTG